MEKLGPGRHVIFMDSYGKPRNALLTRSWDNDLGEEAYVEKYGCKPTVNLLIISPDEKKTDGCGRQSEHHTSVPHKSNQPNCPGYYWVYPDEL